LNIYTEQLQYKTSISISINSLLLPRHDRLLDEHGYNRNRTSTHVNDYVRTPLNNKTLSVYISTLCTARRNMALDVGHYAWNLEITEKGRYIYRTIQNDHENRSFQ